MKIRATLLLFFAFLSISLPAQLFLSEVEKGFKALDKNEFDKAQNIFREILASDSINCPAHFGLARLYFTKGFTGFSADKAHGEIKAADRDYASADKKEIGIMNRLNINTSAINDLNRRIDDELFSTAAAQFSTDALTQFIATYPGNRNIEEAKMLLQQLTFFNVSASNSEEALDAFIEKNKGSSVSEKAIKIRNKLAFQKAKAANTIEALEQFIGTHPDADEIEEAKVALASLKFAEAKTLNTIAAFDSFMVNYPDALEFNEAMNLRNQLAYISLLEEQSKLKSAQLNQKDAVIEETGNRLNLLLAGLGVVVLLAGVLLWSYYQKRKSNREILHQKTIIEQKNTEIVDSINYAQRIQQSLLPDATALKALPGSSFVFFKPRDIVSGDFYWTAQSDDYHFVAVADCTGHGVPGSLVSMIGINFLNQLVNESGITDPGKILDLLHVKISTTLNKDASNASQSTRDGMDIALCRINPKTREIAFSGAVRPLLCFDNDGMKFIKSGMYSIGGIKSLTEEPFTTQYITSKGETTLYLFTDGYADQFGGEQGKKFKMKKLRELLEQLSTTPFEKQEQQLRRSFDQWKGMNEQVDDVCILGLKF